MSVKILGTMLALVAIATILSWYAAFREDPHGAVRVMFFTVGKSVAVFIETPSGKRVLVNGGSDTSIIRELGTVMPFYDRSIDIVVASAQTADAVGGLANVLSRYSVSAIVRSAAGSSAPQVQAFVGAVSSAQQNGARLLIAQRGTVIDLGRGAFMEFFFPDRDASQMSPGDGCFTFKLSFGKTSFLFPCGSPAIATYLATLDGVKLRSDVLLATGKEPELFLGYVSPQFAVVPCAAAATSSAFEKFDIQVIDACANVEFVSDGQTVTRK